MSQSELSMEAVFGPPEQAPRRPRRDDEFELEIAGFDAKGLGLGVVGSYAIRIRRALPGERVRARVQRRRRDAIEGQVLLRLETSPDAVPARCPHTADCGGCSFQELAYPRQRHEKRALAQRLLAPIAELLPADLPEVMGPERIDRYRNKMDFTFSDQRWTEAQDDGRPLDFALGLHSPRRWEKVLDVAACVLAPAWCEAFLADVRELAREHDLSPWSAVEHTGFLRHLVLREGTRTGERMAYLVTSPGEPPGFDAFVAQLLARNPDLTTLVRGVTERLSGVAVGESEVLLHGPGAIHERLGAARFRISPTSFFQTNTEQAERLVELAGAMLERLRAAEGAERGVLFDLYCGAGAFGLALAERFDAVVGLELVEGAVADARVNAAASGIDHARFEAGDVLALLEPARAAELGLPAPDAAIVDPPRAGLHAGVAEGLAARGPRALIYVSCNLAAAARDLTLLCEGAYELVELALVDLFPHTPHLEGVFALRRR